MNKLSLSSLLVLLMVGVGCATKPPDRSLAVNKMSNLRMEMNQEVRQIDATITALTQLTTPSATQTDQKFATFAQEFDRLESGGRRVAEKTQLMQKETRSYFEKWSKRVQKIDEATIRAVETKRVAEARAMFDDLNAKLRQSRQAIVPLRVMLRDVRNHLDKQITPEALETVRTISQSATRSADQIKPALKEAVDRLSKVELALWPDQ